MRLRPPVIALAAIALLAACGEAPSQPATAVTSPEVAQLAGRVAGLTQTYTSGSHVTAWGPIYQNYGANWGASACSAQPSVALNDSRWGTAHGASDFGLSAHPWQGYGQNQSAHANWINAWGNINSSGGPGYPGVAVNPAGHNWSKYETPVAGTGSFVLSLLADNCSWVYLDGTLVGTQLGGDLAKQYGVTLNGTHMLTFMIFDGGGLAGGMYRLETTTTPITPLNPDLDGDGHINTADAFPLDPLEWTDTDGDGHGDNGDAFPANALEWLDTDHDGVGDNSDAFPLDPLRWLLTVPTTTTVSFGAGPFTYSGSAFTATATVNDPTLTASIVYTGDCINAGNTCTATATYAGDATHDGSVSTPAQITIAQATSTTTVGFGAGPFVFKGSAFAATASVSPGGTAAIVYAGDCTNAGSSCVATATYAGDANHTGSVSAPALITITKASSTTTVSFGAGPFVFKGSAFTATAASTAATSLIGGPVIAYTGDCTNGGITCTATATYGGDPNHTGSNATAKITITYAVCAASGGDDDDDREGKASRGLESGSTLPVKLSVCDALGRNISSRSLAVKAVSVSPTGSLNDSGKANPGYLFRLDDGKYMFNLSTKGLVAGSYTLDYTIGNDPTVYHYAFIIRAEKSKEKEKDGKKP